MRVLYQMGEGLSRGNLRKLEDGTLFDLNLSVRPFSHKLSLTDKRGRLSGVETVQNLLRGAKGDEDDEHGERGVFHGCIIPEGRGFVQRKLQKSCELVQKQNRQAKTDEFEDFEEELRFLHVCIIPHFRENASLSRRK